MANRRPAGDGMVRQKKRGQWEGRITVGHKSDGKPIFRYVYGKTQKETLEKLHRRIEDYRGVELTEDSKMTLGEWLDRWLGEYMIFTIRESTWDMIGHVSSATTLDIYSHITTEMQISAAQKIDKGIGKADTTIREEAVPTPKKRERTMTDFKPKQGKIRKSGTGGIYQISENLWEGRFTPTNAQGKREAHNVYAKTKEECERLLDEMIVEVRQQIQAEKEQMKGMSL